ncbi:MAG TPA: bifunctional oligoribonuclease/PAP phosphatase NrnA [Saprospiraceae bacterium]|nr:bifunctional oligoribonuclease/PAP phosphatase NrnA [Saprospiraceae bacterium]
MQDALKKLEALLENRQNIVVLSHRNPDGDAIGSSLAVFQLLKEEHNVTAIVPSEYPSFFDWMHGLEHLLVYDLQQEACKEKIAEASLIIFLDFNALDRIDPIGSLIEKNTSANRVMIDHHLHPQPIADPIFSEIASSSTCELVYKVFSALEISFNKNIAEALYLGILTDTGGLTYGTRPETFETVAALNRLGVDNFRMQDLIFNQMSEKQLRILGMSLYKRMEILTDYHTGIIALTKGDYEKFDIQRGDTEGIVNYLLRINNLKFAVFAREQPTGITKISFRSRGSFAVNELASKHFNGGGHKNASGGYSYYPLKSVVKKIKSILPEYKDSLLNAKIYEE